MNTLLKTQLSTKNPLATKARLLSVKVASLTLASIISLVLPYAEASHGDPVAKNTVDIEVALRAVEGLYPLRIVSHKFDQRERKVAWFTATSGISTLWVYCTRNGEFTTCTTKKPR